MSHHLIFSQLPTQFSTITQYQMHNTALCSKLCGHGSLPGTTVTKDNQGPSEIQGHKNLLINDGNENSMYMYINSRPPEQSGFVQLCCVPQVAIQ